MSSFIALLAVLATPLFGEGQRQNPALSAEALFERVSPSIVVVEAVVAVNDRRLGSGVVTGTGRVITNYHVVAGAAGLQVQRGKQVWPATLRTANVERDLAELFVPGLPAPAVALRVSSTLRVGERVYAIGAPQGLELTLSEGIISSLRAYEQARIIQTTTPISVGSSGGGLFDTAGRLIGITSFYLGEGQNLNFALPAEWVVELAAQQASAATERANTLKVAILAPLSGPMPTFGAMTRDGGLLAIEEWNAKGGVLGKRITPLIENSQCSPDPAVSAANKVIDQDRVNFIIGAVCSKASIPVSEIANSKKVVQISPTSTNPDVTVGKDGRVKPFIFRACFIDPLQGTAAAGFALEQLEAKTAFIMLDPSNDYVKGLAEFFEQAFTIGGGTIVGKETYSDRRTDFSAILAKVQAAGPDIVYLPDYYTIVNLVTRQAKAKGIKSIFIGGDGWDSSDLDLEAADGGFFTNHYSPQDPRPPVQRFVRAFGQRYRDPTGQPRIADALAALAYDATNLLLQAITKANTANPEQVKDALAAITFDGVTGRMAFDEYHNPVKAVTVLAVRYGRVEFHTIVSPRLPGPPMPPLAAPTPPAPAPPLQASLPPEELYRNALADYTKGDYEQAIAGFRRYLQAYPKTSLAANAQYWLGESYYGEGEYAKAIQEFEGMIRDYPENPKVPSALFKRGEAYLQVGDTRRASEALCELLGKYPRAREARLARERNIRCW